VFAQQSLQPKLSRRRYASDSYALQNSTVFRTSQYQWRITNRQWEWIPECWIRNSNCQFAKKCWAKCDKIAQEAKVLFHTYFETYKIWHICILQATRSTQHK